MTGVPLGLGAFNRGYAEEPEIHVLNRFFERNPTNQVEQTALLARPGDKLFLAHAEGKVRQIDHQVGVFDNDLFYVVGETLYRFNGTGPSIVISGTISGTGLPSMTFVSGAGYQHLFIADGLLLQVYRGESAASDILTASGGISAGEVVSIDSVFYEYTAGGVDVGTPLGTVGDPYLVALGAGTEEALTNLRNAMNLAGVPGTDYSTATQINVNVEGETNTATDLIVRARVIGPGGNTIPVTETGVNLSWATPTLEGGGLHGLQGVATPDDVGMVVLETLASFVLTVVSNSQRFYWIRPGTIIIDAFDFAEVESEPDQIVDVIRIGDSLWFFGATSTEVWYATGALDPTASQFAPQRGLAFSQGAVPGTAVAIRSQIVVVAEDGIVYEIVGGTKSISTNSIEEQIRLSRTAQEGI